MHDAAVYASKAYSRLTLYREAVSLAVNLFLVGMDFRDDILQCAELHFLFNAPRANPANAVFPHLLNNLICIKFLVALFNCPVHLPGCRLLAALIYQRL